MEVDAPMLSTAGHVVFPEGHQDGDPGPILTILSACRPIWNSHGLRWLMWKSGNFKLIISVK
jgi:hypothetical protein